MGRYLGLHFWAWVSQVVRREGMLVRWRRYVRRVEMEDCCWWWWWVGMVSESIEFEEWDGLERESMTERGREGDVMVVSFCKTSG